MKISRKQKDDLKLLYIQIRKDFETREEEHGEFSRFSGLRREQIVAHNVFDVQDFEPDILGGYDGVFVGGSSDEGDDLLEYVKPYVCNTGRLLRTAIERSMPVFASCFGFQTAAVELGGEFVSDKDNQEMGTYDITLTEDGIRDPLFKETSPIFTAVSGHAKRVSALPPGAVHLAFSPRCPYHAFRIGERFYATQFHPEVDRNDLIVRITRYKERYLDDDGSLQKIIDSSVETPAANALIGAFVERIVL